MNDVLRTLREARPAELDPDLPVGEDVRRAELARAMAAAPTAAHTAAPPVPARRRVRPGWGLGLAGAVTAGAVVAAAVLAAPMINEGGGTDGDGPRPGSGGGRPSRSTPGPSCSRRPARPTGSPSGCGRTGTR
ncbi:hypothetical protein [Actinomadura madurae]|uniref:hypothetical protein n=1 Tax=Actinomadura madurae TaxID=1993 RepID=UPI0020D23D6B|nr:hypothetical protein [Actinomadura madurae]MCQ0007413.1 hypothetical protein [Actinomadura madurae]